MGRPPLVLFDGVCNLCHGTVRGLIRLDRRGVLRFASLQSEAGRRALGEVGRAGADSIVLIDERDGQVRVFERSDAAIAIARHLGWPWALAGVALIVPRPIRDALYGVVARRRYRWFGRRDSCPIPTPELRARFLDADEPAPPAA